MTNRLKDFSKELKKFNAKKIQAETLSITRHKPTTENRLNTETIRFQAGRMPRGWKAVDLTLTLEDGGTLEDGTKLDDIKLGDFIKTESGGKPADGNYKLIDGRTITIKDSQITKIEGGDSEDTEDIHKT